MDKPIVWFDAGSPAIADDGRWREESIKAIHELCTGESQEPSQEE